LHGSVVTVVLPSAAK